MSAIIWMEIEAAVKEARPDLLSHFRQNCRDGPSIREFLRTNFPLEKKDKWEEVASIHIPNFIREKVHLWKSPNGLKNEDDDE